MRHALLVTISFAIAVPGGTAAGDEKDAIVAELEKAKAAQKDAAAKARTGLLDAFDEAIKATAQSGDLDGVKSLRAERKAFAETGKSPVSSKMGSAAGEYQKAVRAAKVTLEKAFEQAIKDSTKALKIEQAEAIRNELKVFQGNGPVGKAPDKAPMAPLRPADITTKDGLKQFLMGTEWLWGFGTRFKPDGYVGNTDWETRGLVTRWEAVDRRTVVLTIEKGRDNDLHAILLFSEDLGEFSGYDFMSRAKMEPKKRKR